MKTQDVVEIFSAALGTTPDHSIKDRPDGSYLVFEFAETPNRLFDVLNQVNAELSEEHPFKDRVTLAKRSKKPRNVVDIPETKLLQRELSESLTVDRDTFGEDFFERYTPSVTNFESRIVERSNFVVYGRRGSGKSSLLSFAMHTAKRNKKPFAWVAMQTYGGRKDYQTIASVVAEIVLEFAQYSTAPSELRMVAEDLKTLGESASGGLEQRLHRQATRLRQLIKTVSNPTRPATIFLDDIHTLGIDLQPRLLGFLWSLSRGNNVHIKCSGIEQFTNTWISSKRIGLEPPHDTQILKLDYNLTMPDKSLEHIRGILDAHAKYCGLPGISYIADDSAVARLVLVAAAVPRDALSLFSQAITRSSIKKQTMVSITSLNAAASETIEEKLKDVGRDASSEDERGLSALLERVRDFCVVEQRQNAFLVRIDNASAGYREIQKLIALRFVHVLHEGITPHKAGERFIALMLDFGFYIGIRAAKSVSLYPDSPRQLPAKELRRLPIFDPGAADVEAA